MQWLEGLKTRLPVNARMVLPRDPLSTYDLMDIADIGITYGLNGRSRIVRSGETRCHHAAHCLL